MPRVSEKTMEVVAAELCRLLGDGDFEHADPEEQNRWKILTPTVIKICRLPVEVENRKRLISEQGLAAAAAQIDDDLPEDFEWPEEGVTTDRVFASAVLGAFAATEARPIE